MKKKIGIILAVLLLVSLVFTFVACGTDGAKSINGVTAEQITEKYAEVEAFLDSWVRSNSQETITNQSDALKNSLKAAAKESLAFVDGDQNLVKPSYTVSFDKKTSKYTVNLDWGNGAVKKTFVVAAKTPEYANWAGKGSNAADYTRIDSEDAASSNLNALIKAMAYSVNEVTSQSVTGKFSVDTIIGLDVMGFNYGLRVKANIDTASAANTQVGLILVNEDKEELGGLFYEGAETVAESKIYIEYSTVEDDVRSYSYKWIDYADILGFVKKILPETKDQPGKGIFEEVYEGDEGEYYENAVEGLGDLLGLFGVGMGDLIEGILDMVAHGYESADGSQLLVDIDLGEVMANITDMIADFGIDTSKLPDFLGDIGLDLNTMHGLRGHISISGKIDNDGDTPKLVDFELAVNIPKDTVFYLSADESADGVKIEIPAISFALYLNDFAFFTDEEVDVIPAAAKEATQDGSGYFSPTNLDVSGNVYIKHVEGTETVLDDTFAFEFVTDINPLEIIQNKFDSAAKAGLKITQYQGKGTTGVSSNFLTITYEQNLRLLCVSGTAFGLDDGNKVYTFEMTDK
ncbi:MAG TPA: hypothetical protein DIC18_00065, partial [Clostridiales bacterium]|nr:hypothetical protein [Clostridiales bacterium]